MEKRERERKRKKNSGGCLHVPLLVEWWPFRFASFFGRHRFVKEGGEGTSAERETAKGRGCK